MEDTSASIDWTAIVNAANDGLKTIAAAKSSDETNRQRLKIAREQMEWNEKMMQYQNSWQESMYNKYYSPKAEREQKLSAGINPLADTNSPSAMPSSASVNGYSAPTYTNPYELFMQQSLNSANINNMNADTEQKYAETARTLQLTPHEVRQIEENTNLAHQNIQNLLSQKNLTDEQRRNLEIIDKWLDTEKEFELHKKISDIAVNESIAKLNEEQAEKLRYEIENILPLQKINAELSNEQLEELIKETRQKIALLAKQTGIAEKDLINYSYNHMPEYAKLGVEITKAAKENNKKQSQKIVNGLNKVGAWFMDRLSSAYDLSW